MMAGDEQPRVRFLIAGMARSGTTLYQRIVSELVGVAVPPETHFWRHAPALASNHRWPADRAVSRRALVEYLAKGDHNLTVDIDAVIERLGTANHLWDLFDAVVADLAPPGRMILGEKTPDHALWAASLMRTRSELTVLGLIRDPREVFRSHRGVPWGIHDAAAFATKWVAHARALEDLIMLYPDRTLVVDYDELANSPDEHRDRAAKLIGASGESADIGDDAVLFDKSEWWKADAIGQIERAEPRWKDELAPDQLETLAAIAGRAALQWGYDLTAHQSNESVAASLPQYESARRVLGMNLPIDAETTRQWNMSAGVKLQAAVTRNHDLNEEATRLREWLDRAKTKAEERTSEARHWRTHANRLASSIAELSERKDRQIKQLDSSLARATAEARKLQASLDGSRQSEYTAVRRAMNSDTHLARAKARRWWRIGEALSNWARRPWQVGRLARSLTKAARKHELPPLPTDDQVRAQVSGGDVRPPKRADAAAAFAAGDYERALLLLDGPMTFADHLLARDCQLKLGEMSAALEQVRQALRLRNDPALRRQERQIVGRLRETDTQWLPEVPQGGRSATDGKTILHVLKESLPYFERGYTIRSQTSLDAQVEAGYQPVVVTSLGFPRAHGFESFDTDEQVRGVRHVRLDLGPLYDSTAVPFDEHLTNQATLTHAVAEGVRPALVQAGSGYRGYETALTGLSVARSLDVPFIYEIRSFLEQTWTAETHRSEKGEYYERRFAQETRCLREADTVITIAESMKIELVSRGVPEEKISVVPNVVDTERFAPRSKRSDLRDRLGLTDRPTIGYVSNLGPREGIHHLIEAVGILRDQGFDAAGLVAGDGPEAERLREMVDALGLADAVVLTGHVPNHEIEDYYALIDVFVVPRIDDRAARLVTPLKPLEAMSMGLPVVAADLPALRELAKPGERGLVFKTGDSHDLARTCAELLHDDTLRQSLAAGGRKWVHAERTISANAKRYASILENTLSGRDSE